MFMAETRDAPQRRKLERLYAQYGKKMYAAARNYSPAELRAARYRMLAVRERVVSSGSAGWRTLLEKELVRAVSRPGRAAR